jgi:hypothetical protein
MSSRKIGMVFTTRNSNSRVANQATANPATVKATQVANPVGRTQRTNRLPSMTANIHRPAGGCSSCGN